MRNKEYSWYMLSNTPHFGPKTIRYIYDNLQEKNMSINDLFDIEENELYKLFPEVGRGSFSRASFSRLQELDDDANLYSKFEELISNGVTIIGLDDAKYPQSVLQNMGDDAPPILYCKGNLSLLNKEGISIVGARDAYDFEIGITKEIAQRLAEKGINVISGYAKGIDTSAHLGALEAGGTTIMILSFGINHITIKRELKAFDLEKNALFVSQFEPDEKFSGKNAMIRNKLVCAMSKAVVVIKSGPEKDSSGKMSGTFDAGKSALKMKIPVWVLSPQVFNSPPQGNIDLIRSGGKEFSKDDDIEKFFEKHPEKKPIPLNTQINDNQKLKNKKKTKKKPSQSQEINLFSQEEKV